jgi:hypothetical protein
VGQKHPSYSVPLVILTAEQQTFSIFNWEARSGIFHSLLLDMFAIVA